MIVRVKDFFFFVYFLWTCANTGGLIALALCIAFLLATDALTLLFLLRNPFYEFTKKRSFRSRASKNGTLSKAAAKIFLFLANMEALGFVFRGRWALSSARVLGAFYAVFVCEVSESFTEKIHVKHTILKA